MDEPFLALVDQRLKTGRATGAPDIFVYSASRPGARYDVTLFFAPAESLVAGYVDEWFASDRPDAGRHEVYEASAFAGLWPLVAAAFHRIAGEDLNPALLSDEPLWRCPGDAWSIAEV